MDKYFVLNSLSDLGSWASLIGLGGTFLTIISFVLLLSIRKKFLFRSSIELHQAKLAEQANEIASLLADYNNKKSEIDELLELADVELRAIQRGASNDLLKDVNNARALIKDYLKKPFLRYSNTNKTEQSARTIKTKMTVIVAQFEHVKKHIIVGAS
ncbi:hypothetical protein ACET5Z_18000 [Aeromonas veronii]